MPQMMVQDGDLCDDPAVASASALRESLAVDEEFRDALSSTNLLLWKI